MQSRRFFWTTHPARGMLEAWLIGLALLFLLSLQVGRVPPAVLSNGLLFLCGVCGMWAVLRIRVPQGGWPHQGLWELAVGFALSMVMVVGMGVPALFLGWEGVWLQSSFGNELAAILLFLATGPGYLIARAGVRIWLVWDRLRHQRMLWAIAHAQLTVVVLVILLAAAGMFLLSPYSRTENLVPPDSAGVLTSITERLLHTVFPGMSMVIVLTGVTLLVLLPPSILFSFLVARRTTRRLETLVDAAKALREGQYDARVQVVGEDEVAQLQSDFNAMAGDLERTLHDLQVQRDRVSNLLQSRRELVANVSHELRTPIATVRATLESALNRGSAILPDDVRHDLEVMDGEIARLQSLIDDLFTLARADTGALTLECQPMEVGPVVQHVVDALAPLAWNSGRVEVVAELVPDLPPARADGARLGQIVSNLVHNGVQHTPPGGIVAVLTGLEKEAICIQVRDTGEGIAPEDLPHIWERFYRGRNDQAGDGSGAGLGLALVKELAEAMGGHMDVESTVGQGSCFTLKLPVA